MVLLHYTILVWRILDPIPTDVPTNIKGKHVSYRKLCFCWVLLYFMQVNTVKHHLAAVSVCLPDKQHYYYSTSPRVLADRHLHCSLFKAGGVCDYCCHQAEDMLLCNVKCCLCSFTARNQCASCPFTHSFSPICQPVFFFLTAPSQSTYTMSLLTCCPFFLTQPHVTGKNLLHYRLIHKKMCKEASQGDKALRVKGVDFASGKSHYLTCGSKFVVQSSVCYFMFYK